MARIKCRQAFASGIWLASLLVAAVSSSQAQVLNTNLVVNGGAEDRPAANTAGEAQNIPPGWTVTGAFAVADYEGSFFRSDYGPIDRGARFFYGRLAGQRSSATQVVDLSAGASDIDTGRIRFCLSGYLGYFGATPDSMETISLRAEFLDQANTVLLTATAAGPEIADIKTVSGGGLLLRLANGYLLPGTRKARITIDLAVDSTHYNAADNISLVLTDDPPVGANLLVNGDAETVLDGMDPANVRPLPGWNANAVCTASRYGGPDLPKISGQLPPDPGKYLLVCPSMEATADAYQTIDITAIAALVDSGRVSYDLSAWLGGPGDVPDYVDLKLTFFDGSDPRNALGGETLPPVTQQDLGTRAGLQQRSLSGIVPAGARLVRLTLTFNRLRTDDRPGMAFADSVSLVLNATALTEVMNAASYQSAAAVSAGESVTLRGAGLGPETAVQSGIVLEKALGGATVTFGGIEAYLSYVSTLQINAVVPYGVSRSADAVVRYAGKQTDPFPLAVVESAPGIFIQQSGSSQARAVNQDKSSNSTSNPARRGTKISLWATGQGPVIPAGVDGEIIAGYKDLALPLSLTIGGVDATVVFTGLIRYGEIQVDAIVPNSIPPGNAEVLLTIGKATSRTGVTVAVAADPVPQLTAVETSPGAPLAGQPFTFTLTGTNFEPSNAVVSFSGPGCTSPCIVSRLTGSSTQLTGTATLARGGSYTITARNSTTGIASNAIALTVSSATPQLTAIATVPDPAVTGQPFNFTLTGVSLEPEVAVAYFSGPGCATPCTVSRLTGFPGQLTGTATLPASGSFTVTLRNGENGLVSNSLSLAVAPPPPTINEIRTTPDPPLAGQAFKFTITGTNFNPATAVVDFTGPGCSTSCSVSGLAGSATQLTGSIALQGGSFTFTIRNGAAGTASNGGTLTVRPGTPSIASVVTLPSPPVSGLTFTFTIVGANFDLSTIAYFSGPGCSTPCPATMLTATDTQLTGSAVLPSPGAFSVTVRNGTNGVQSNAVSLTAATPSPSITGITTTPGPPVAGQPFAFSIAGTYFDPATAAAYVYGSTCNPCIFGNNSSSPVFVIGSATLSSGNYIVIVRNGFGGAASNGFPLVVPVPGAAAPPQIGAISTSPNPAIAGQPFSFTITGTGLNPATATAYFSGPACAVPCRVRGLTGTSTQVTGSATLPSGTFSVTVLNSDFEGASNSLSLSVAGGSSNGGPQLTGISTSPASPLGGQQFTFTIAGANLSPSTATAYFSGPGCAVPCSVFPLTGSSTQVSGSATLLAGTFTVTVWNSFSSGASNGLSLTVSGGSGAGPQLSAITTSPSPPMPGQPFNFTISGSGLNPFTAIVNFSGPGCATLCSVQGFSGSSTQLAGSITLTSAGTYSVTVQNSAAGSASNALSLGVSSPGGGPQLTTIATSPTPPVLGQPFTFTIAGANFDPSTAIVSFSGPGCNPACSPATLTGSATQLNGSTTLPATGAFTVTVRNGATGTASNSISLAVTDGSTTPLISGITTAPSPPLPGQSFNLTISGANFDPQTATIYFSGPGCSPLCTVKASGSATQVGGSITLLGGSYTVTVRNGAAGTPSNAMSLVVSGGGSTPHIALIITQPYPPTAGLPFIFEIDGSNFDRPATVYFAGPGCSGTSCAVGDLRGSGTQLLGSTTLAAGTFSVTVQNGSGAVSNAVQLTVM